MNQEAFVSKNIIKSSIIRFPDITLKTRDAHKLRGYFGKVFRDKSPLLHNHFKDGSLMYKYPFVQYKVIDSVPMLVGLNEGAELLTDLFLNLRFLKLDDKDYFIDHKNIENKKFDIEVADDLFKYDFVTLWMALNQNNYKSYVILKRENLGNEIKDYLKNILIGNILSFYKSIGYHAEKRILLTLETNEKMTKFKDNDMIAFDGFFTTNALLPNFIGLGKSVSRGFGTIKMSK